MKTTTKRLFLLMIVLCAFVHTNSFATKWIINVQNFSFSPSSLPSVFVGDTLRWVWINGSHTTTYTIIPPSAPTWDNPINVSNQFFEYVPSIVGIYNYKCTPHAGMGMVGSFIVSSLPFISLNLKVFLEGPFNGTGMNTDLNTTGLIPLAQPYNGVPGIIQALKMYLLFRMQILWIGYWLNSGKLPAMPQQLLRINESTAKLHSCYQMEILLA